MRCSVHNAEAIGICVHCGVALCPSCAIKTDNGRLTCSPKCEEAIATEEYVLKTILTKTTKGYHVNAFFCFLLGGLWIVFAVLAVFFNIWPVAIFLGVMAIGYIIGGFAYRRAEKKNAYIIQPTMN